MSDIDLDAPAAWTDPAQPRGADAGAAGAATSVSPPYRPAKVPVAPVLSWSTFGFEGGQRPPSILDAGQTLHVTSGRVAIAMALRAMRIGPGDKVLVPAYHCASMIEPVIWSGATPVYYKVKPDTSVDFDDLAAKVDGAARLVCVANYFGFPQPLATVRAFCDQRKLFMLEDCAHGFFGALGGVPVGSTGDYAIASSMKFFPLYEGGALVSARHSLEGVKLRASGLGFELKMALNGMEEGFQYGRMGALKLLLGIPLALKNALWGMFKKRHPQAPSMAPNSSEGAFGFDPAWIDRRSSLYSRWVMKTASHRRIAALRRANYLQLQAALAGLPGCRPLFPALPEQVYPWGFPLQVDQPQALFEQLKRAGVPIIRFAEFPMPGVDAATCPVSRDLARRVFNFPCHQELRPDELAWMINQIRSALQNHDATHP